MMAALFLLATLMIGGIYLGKRPFAIILLLITLALCWLMFWHHATDTLKINW
jgi:hypothetical protein